ncbi:MAG: hypothetical protein NT002_09910 [candidate division Zixibacteria bacterium]|nr:hypothetical protein [candidate division Zixibacteria bacterium]
MGTIEKSFLPILNQLLIERVSKCERDFDDELFACQYGINTAVACLATSHYLHADDRLGAACKLHCSKVIHDFLAAFQLARSSMHSQAANAIRLACETAWQSAAFHERPALVEAWYRGEQLRPIDIRSAIKRLAKQRQFLYQELSAIAHPNPQAMVALRSWPAGQKEIDLDVLLPVYQAEEIARTLRALFVAQFIAQLDFDAYHLGSLEDEQRSALAVQAKCMAEYYTKVIEPSLPSELCGITMQMQLTADSGG